MRTTSTKADEYDKSVPATIPLYHELHNQLIDVVAHRATAPGRWLESGCGTGALAGKLATRFPGTELHLIDPSDEMIEVARERLKGVDAVKELRLLGAENLDYPDDHFDVVSAVLSHHYFQPEGRRQALDRIHRALKSGGMYIAFEHVAPNGKVGLDIALARWRDYQIEAGKTPDKAAAYLTRYGKEFHPITAEAHLALLRETGFADAEIFWYAYGQIGVYGVK